MPFVLAVDYDGTLVENVFPEEGSFKKDVVNKVKEFKDNGAEVILWTCREGASLAEAIGRCYEKDVEFDAVNENSPSELAYIEKQKAENGDILAQRKIYADLYIDDKSPGSIEFFLKIDVQKTCKNFEDRS
ncbi:MAG TPA: hypothetical protein VMX17_07110 [Candidatus Glassbacteria bacterium]|nr:hypothetical protein [Candidatus Glassbacteria bacterium]